jgi:membrane-associated phospholipid phosphatase
VAALYLTAIGLCGGLRTDHVLAASVVLFDSYNEKARSFLRLFWPFLLTGVIYDSMRYYYWRGVAGHIHVGELYFAEKRWLGLTTAAGRLTLNEYFQTHTHVALDLLCGFAYLAYVTWYLAAAFLLFLTDRHSLLRRFGWCFFVVNLMGFATYFLYPAAPPWYVAQYGFGPARLDVAPAQAAAQRFDQILGTHLFDHIYGRGIDVYGALPSLHVSYPFLVVWLAFRVKWGRVPAVAFYLLMSLAAVYLQHHYILDVLCGTAYAALALWLVCAAFRVRTAQAT